MDRYLCVINHFSYCFSWKITDFLSLYSSIDKSPAWPARKTRVKIASGQGWIAKFNKEHSRSQSFAWSQDKIHSERRTHWCKYTQKLSVLIFFEIFEISELVWNLRKLRQPISSNSTVHLFDIYTVRCPVHINESKAIRYKTEVTYRTRTKIRASLFKSHAVFECSYFRKCFFQAMLIQNFN